MAILKVETDIIVNISASSIGRAGIFVIMSVKALSTDLIVFIGDVIMCFTSDCMINLHIRTDPIFLWINVSSVIQTLSVAHIKGKISNLPINYNDNYQEYIINYGLHEMFISKII